MIMGTHDWTGKKVVIVIKLSVGKTTIVNQEEIIFADSLQEKSFVSKPTWIPDQSGVSKLSSPFIASAPTTVISFGVKSKLITVLALHLSAFWLFSFLQSCHHLFLTSGPTVITSCHWHQTTTSGKFYSRFCTFETWDPVFWKFPFRTNYKMKLTWSLPL